MTDTIIYEDASGSKEFQTEALLAAQGKLFITDDINAQSASSLIRAMMYLADCNIPITLYIDCCGGEIRSGLAIIDAMEILSKKVEINVVCIGKAYSMASLILAAGTKGHRYIMPHGEIMVHEPLVMNGAAGSASSVRNQADSLIAIRDKIGKMLSNYTGLPFEKINAIMYANTFMDAKEAIEAGMVDSITEEL